MCGVVVKKFTKIKKKMVAKKDTYKWPISIFEAVASDLLFSLGVNGTYELLFGLGVKWNWFFFYRVQNFQSSGVSIRLLQKKKFFYNIVRHVMIRLWVTFKWFPMNWWSARSHLVTFSSKKNLTSNDCKPIGLLPKIPGYIYMLRYSSDYNIVNFE